jgi:hypothetical protein
MKDLGVLFYGWISGIVCLSILILLLDDAGIVNL